MQRLRQAWLPGGRGGSGASGSGSSGSSSGSGGMSTGRALRLAVAGAAAAGAAWVTFRVARRLYAVFTYSDAAAHIDHGVAPEDEENWDHRPLLLPPTLQLLRELGAHDALAPLAEAGSLLAMQPAAWIGALEAGRVPEGFPAPARAVVEAASAARAAAEGGGGGGEGAAEALGWLSTSGDVGACLAVGAPLTIVMIGTSHVSKKSAEEVERALQLLRPDLLFLELDPARAALMYRDGEPEAGPAPSTIELLQQALAEAGRSPKGDVLQALLSAMYKSLEAQLGVKAGLEFTAARRAAEGVAEQSARQMERELRRALRALPGGGRELERERAAYLAAAAAAAQQQRQQNGGEGGEGGGGWGSGEEEASGGGSDDGRGGEGGEGGETTAAAPTAVAAAAAGPPRNPVANLQIVLGDRPASETLKAMWGALRPWRRVQFCWEIVRGLFEPLDEDFIEAMKDDDLLTAIFKEMRETFPELMGPLLHDRNWVLAVGSWRAAAAAAAARRQALEARCSEFEALAERELAAARVPPEARPPGREAAAAAARRVAGGGCKCGGGGCAACGALVVAVVGKGHMKGVALSTALLAAAAAVASGARLPAAAEGGGGGGGGGGEGPAAAEGGVAEAAAVAALAPQA
ncbi:hypothetical protein Rsub_10081 [Raphidocelis subcapitata]|uniref:TraB domain-containing protein n=1 Tax=Raphidocelis subcapitata TaxID=307507 RepID=A0A2V0PH21_9CHLO|nr:hypothetical protein Rsub_10081 [Raphidocelis subcapitata]|eukprot:GBF97220.1 hypothetical protein Rsub_10081 [Raphidocelis subcapitata]